jgi:ornithine cyclodeaminase
MDHSKISYFSSEDIFRILPTKQAISLFSTILNVDNFVYKNPARLNVENTRGHLLVMPSEISGTAGIKIAAVVPSNPDQGFPRIQASFLLQDGQTMQPLAIFDGNALTVLRTSALSAAVLGLFDIREGINVGIFGTGPQAIAHAKSISEISKIDQLYFFSRNSGLKIELDEWFSTQGFLTQILDSNNPKDHERIIPQLDVIVTATSAKEPLFDSALINDEACVIAIGSHEPDFSEIDIKFFERAEVFVEDLEIAAVESGEIVQALRSNLLSRDEIKTIFELKKLNLKNKPKHGPKIYKSVGMGWEDLAVANAIYSANTI